MGWEILSHFRALKKLGLMNISVYVSIRVLNKALNVNKMKLIGDEIVFEVLDKAERE